MESLQHLLQLTMIETGAWGCARTGSWKMGARLSYPEVDQSGRVAVVTGGNTGIGYETAKGLAVLGAHVVIACRSEERARNVSIRITLAA